MFFVDSTLSLEPTDADAGISLTRAVNKRGLTELLTPISGDFLWLFSETL